jgi:GNAT superfamily N-acetyltransferase
MSQEVKLFNPSQLDKGDWRQLQTIQRYVFSDALDRPQEDIDYLVQWNDPTRFYASHIDPNSEVGKSFNPDQSYVHSRVAVAIESGKPVGFAYAAHNVSGSSSVGRFVKRLSVVKNYLWLREIAVKPELQKEGLAKHLGRTLLNDAIDRQPVAAYIWPEEIGFLPEVLSKLGFTSTGEQQVSLFGKDRAPVKQVRVQAPSVSSVLAKLN